MVISNFRVRSWVGNIPMYFHTDCHACHRIGQRERHKRKKADQAWMDKRRESGRLHAALKRRRQGVPELPRHIKDKRVTASQRRLENKQLKVQREPLADFIQTIIDNGTTITEIAERVAVDQARIRVILAGQFHKKGKVYSSDTVTLGFADKVIVALSTSETIYDIYPELRDDL
jgi:hypothetical protein